MQPGVIFPSHVLNLIQGLAHVKLAILSVGHSVLEQFFTCLDECMCLN